MLIAYFLILILVGHDCPVLVGPFEDRSGCLDVREWVERRGYETGGCSVLSLPQEAIMVHVGELP